MWLIVDTKNTEGGQSAQELSINTGTCLSVCCEESDAEKILASSLMPVFPLTLFGRVESNHAGLIYISITTSATQSCADPHLAAPIMYFWIRAKECPARLRTGCSDALWTRPPQDGPFSPPSKKPVLQTQLMSVQI